MAASNKPTVAVYKFSSCDGCQLSLLNLEDELLDLANAIEIAFFLEARRRILPGPYDIGIVEGSVSTEEEIERIKEIRKECTTLIALGSCATAGGVQALKNFGDVSRFTEIVYPHPEYIKTLSTSTPISEHVTVELELTGCPVNKYQVAEIITALLHNRRPFIPDYSVCLECKRRGITCVMVAKGTPCLGPITQAGCNAICPSQNRGCYGCFGPLPSAEIDAFMPLLKEKERYPGEAVNLLRTICGHAPSFRYAAELLLKEEA